MLNMTRWLPKPAPQEGKVTVAAGNDETPSGEVRHDTAKVIRQVTVDGPREARTPNAAAHRRRPYAPFASPVPPFIPAYSPFLWVTTPDLRATIPLFTRPAPNDTSPEGVRTAFQPASQEPPKKRARKQSSSHSPTSSPPVWRPCPFD
ncbi:hypothetical protein OESDEN_11818 [Oesophagostomum dentatum]|uniref:Uncharacterized protein n=1 Tax=Oesophagostomum dentatum TaxID=61180 RepID=A0A0B1SYV7_OESDE|nr:hypothetical protein OESDEN_11818 [Oesophagostomum dentatum]